MKWTRRRAILGGSALLVLVLLIGSYFGIKAMRAQARTATLCSAIQKQIADRGEVVRTGSGPLVAILGDSYSSGDGLPSYRDAWSFQYARDSSSTVAIDAVGFTGYANGGVCGGATFGSRVGVLLRLHPSTMLIEGGTNDGTFSASQVRSSANAVLQSVAGVPKVVVIGPIDVGGRTGEAGVDRVLKTAAAAHHRDYVSALHWDIPLQKDHTHPSAAGARLYAAKVAAAVN